MKITCLIENLVYRGGLIAEHGLSFLIETGSHNILFDTGQTGNFALNASRLGIDIATVDAVVLSHGHYDHTGGLAKFMELNEKAAIYLKKEALWPKFNGKKEIGFIHKNLSLHHRVKFVTDTVEIAPDIFIINGAPVINQEDTHWKYFITESEGKLIPDSFEDEIFLSIVNEGKLSVISSCSHRGISNILRSATEKFNYPVNMIAGGFHLKDAQPEAIKPIVELFKTINPEKIGVCHCTGLVHYELLRKHFPEQTFYFHTGVMVYV